MALITPWVLSILFGALAAYVINHLIRSISKIPLPPGPRGLPFLGNVNDMPKDDGSLGSEHWLKHKDLYGPLSSVTVLGQTMIIINDERIALEMLRDRAAKHSDRPHQVFSGEMVGWKHTLACNNYTDTWRLHRKNIAKAIGGSKSSFAMFDHVQEAESSHFILNLLRAPDNLFGHVKKEAGAIILKIAYGYTVEPRGSDVLVDVADKVVYEFFLATAPGRWFVDLLPSCEYLPVFDMTRLTGEVKYVPNWMPGAGWKTTARRMARNLDQTTEQPYEFVKKEVREGRHRISFLSQAISNNKLGAEAEHIHKWSASSMYLGGADTSVCALMTFFLAMTLFPEVQRKAQAEIDAVIGTDRLPVSADKARLPFIEAVIKETHRWHPVTPLAIPHCTSTEDIIRGYRIPKGSIILPNTWWFTHNPEVYPEPMEFRPERFLNGTQSEPDPRAWIFGYGRRICPGRFLADNTLFITIAKSLAVFKIEKCIDGDGKIIEPEVRFTPGIVSQPVPYRANIKPRSAKHEELIKATEIEHPWEMSDGDALKSVKW
jgi:hypothetical protein